MRKTRGVYRVGGKSLTKRDAGLKWRSNNKCLLERWRLLICIISAITQDSIQWGAFVKKAMKF